MRKAFQYSCLKPAYSIRKQLLLGFVLPTVVTTSLVVSFGIVFVVQAGNIVQTKAGQTLEGQILISFTNSSKYIAEEISSYINSANGAVQLITDITRDRIVGYPDEGWEDDRFVPFFDIETQRNIYPLQSLATPLDWNLSRTIDFRFGENMEHFPNVKIDNVRRHFFTSSAEGFESGSLSSASGMYHFQGCCNPGAKHVWERSYYPNCTDDNNNIETGGSIQPTNTSQWLQRKSGDLAVFLKAIYEAQPNALMTSIFFANSGAGSVVSYPGYTIEAGSYISRGCDWLSEVNPRTNKSFATTEEIARCHPKGKRVNNREYNPLEREWYIDCILHSEFSWDGPYKAFDSGIELISVCRAVFDRKTGSLIGGASIHMALSDLSDRLLRSRLYQNRSDIAIVNYFDSTLVLDTNDPPTRDRSKVFKTGFISEEDYLALRSNISTCPLFQARSGIYTAFPLPLPSTDNDSSYNPSFLIIHRIPNDVTGAVAEMDATIDENSLNVVLFCACYGALGTMLVFAIVWLVSRMLTEPLRWIEDIARVIVTAQDDSIECDFQGESSKWTPTNEITLLVREFRLLLQGFSGHGAATVATYGASELFNDFTWRSDFHSLCCPASKAGNSLCTRNDWPLASSSTHETLSNIRCTHKNEEKPHTSGDDHSFDSSSAIIFPAPPKKNVGRNITQSATALNKKALLQSEFDQRNIVAFQSSLFWWIIVLISLPLLMTNCLIFARVSRQIVKAVPDWVNVVESSSLELSWLSLESTAAAKASVAETILQSVVRDLHVITRTASWLFFGGINRSEAFTDMDSPADECKAYPADGSCPFFRSGRAICDCAWRDIISESCTVFPAEANTRHLQRRSWGIQLTDSDPITGDRYNMSSFPISSNETEWWRDVDKLPGSRAGKSASGYRTAYDRVRVASAMSTVEIPIYNYPISQGQPRHDIGTSIGFEADGGLSGYSGCSSNFAELSHWVSDQRNRAYELSEDLCHFEKHGFDSRCEDWYAIGKARYESKGAHMYVSAPHHLALDNAIVSSASSPIVNPETGKYVGQSVVKFFPTFIGEALLSVEEPIFVLISPEPHLAVVFSGFSNTSINRDEFEESILHNMRIGRSSTAEFNRSNDKGDTETMYFAFHPVYARAYLGLNPADFARGVSVSQVLTYIVGIATFDDELRRPFSDIIDHVMERISRLRRSYIIQVVIVSFLFTLYLLSITAWVTKPVIILLRVVKIINAGVMSEDLPPLQGGSREVVQVYNSFAKLIKIVRMSNIAFFSGNIRWANEIITDALKLFRKVNDRKAIGIACNNLGNTIYAMMHDCSSASDPDEEMDLYLAAMAHYDEAVSIGQGYFDEAGDEMERSEYAQQLADRLYNRALMGLLAYTRGHAPEEVKELALRDLKRTRALDEDVRDYWLDRKLLLKNSERLFNRLLRRFYGLVEYYDFQDARSAWEASELIEEADNLLHAAWNESSAALFQEVTAAGRLQQLESAAMRLDLLAGKNEEAARLAMRMLVEDEYILESSYGVAAKSILQFLHDKGSDAWGVRTKSCCREDLRKMLKSCKTKNIDLGKSIVFCIEINEQYEADSTLDRIQWNSLRLYDLICSSDDNVAIVAHTTNGDYSVELGNKAENAGIQRARLELATTLTNDRVHPSLPFATQMLVDCSSSYDSDSFIILITDGYSWDPATTKSSQQLLDRLNKERGTKIHLIILGLGVEDPEVRDDYLSLCNLTKQSCYVDINSENMDSVFNNVSNAIRGSSFWGSRVQGLTMEKF